MVVLTNLFHQAYLFHEVLVILIEFYYDLLQTPIYRVTFLNYSNSIKINLIDRVHSGVPNTQLTIHLILIEYIIPINDVHLHQGLE